MLNKKEHDPIISVTDSENQPHQYIDDPERLRTDLFGVTDSERDSFAEAVRPLMMWINENCHPHHIVTVDHTTAELHEGQIAFKTEEYLKD